MKSLPWPGIACCVVSAILVSLVLELATPPPWLERQRLRRRLLEEDLEQPQLPTSNHGHLCPRADLDVVLEHRHLAACPPDCRHLDHWLVQLRAADAAVHGGPYELLDESFRAALQEVNTRHPRNQAHPSIAEATFAIRAPATASIRLVRLLMGMAIRAGFYRVEIALASTAPGGGEQRLQTHLPLADDCRADDDTGGIRISLSRDAATQDCERQLSRWASVWAADVPPAAVPRRAWRCDGSGDAQFRSYVVEWLARHHRPGVSGVVDAADDVPLQAVVDLVGSLRSAGMERVFVCTP